MRRISFRLTSARRHAEITTVQASISIALSGHSRFLIEIVIRIIIAFRSIFTGLVWKRVSRSVDEQCRLVVPVQMQRGIGISLCLHAPHRVFHTEYSINATWRVIVMVMVLVVGGLVRVQGVQTKSLSSVSG